MAENTTEMLSITKGANGDVSVHVDADLAKTALREILGPHTERCVHNRQQGPHTRES